MTYEVLLTDFNNTNAHIILIYPIHCRQLGLFYSIYVFFAVNSARNHVTLEG